MHGGISYIASLEFQNILICNVNLAESKNHKPRLMDLIVFQNNLRRRASLLTFIYTVKSFSWANAAAELYNLLYNL